MAQHVYVKAAGVWHRATLGDAVQHSAVGTSQPIVTMPACRVKQPKVTAARFDEPPADEPRHAACFQTR
jgi:hypothetical protein